MRNSNTVRRTILSMRGPLIEKLNLRNEKYIDTPITNMKNGNTRSVGVSPIHSAWLNGAYRWLQVPGLFTSNMPAMVIPRRISTANNRLLLF